VPAGSLVIGSPAKVVRSLSEQERDELRNWADKYVTVARVHKARFQAKP
jgi:carbonic anhydrase/acetyltransferase-like protein (isoleucine patch superfamily)